MVIKWLDKSPLEPGYQDKPYWEASFFQGLVVLGAAYSYDRPQPDFHAFIRGDEFRALGHFKSLAEAKNAAEAWFRRELLALDF